MKSIICLFLLLSCIIFVESAEANKTCSQQKLKEIKTDFDKAYNQYDVFWDTLHCYGDNAISGDKNSIRAIISLNGIGTYNSEFTEWYAETIAQIFLKSPQKLLDLLLQRDRKTIDNIMTYLEHPIGDVEMESIVAVAKKLKKKPKYRSLAKRLTSGR